jgi:hypothetical protein
MGSSRHNGYGYDATIIIKIQKLQYHLFPPLPLLVIVQALNPQQNQPNLANFKNIAAASGLGSLISVFSVSHSPRGSYEDTGARLCPVLLVELFCVCGARNNTCYLAPMNFRMPPVLVHSRTAATP